MLTDSAYPSGDKSTGTAGGLCFCPAEAVSTSIRAEVNERIQCPGGSAVRIYRQRRIPAIINTETSFMARIRPAVFPRDAAEVLAIWREYISSPSVSLDYQGNETEFTHLPGKYGAPEGCLLLAEIDCQIEGCIAFRKVNETICEMKRLYVRPSARGRGLGNRLVTRVIGEAKRAGYQEMRLDVLAEFKAAQALYTKFGFEAADPVSFNPLPGTIFLGLKLD